MESQIFAVIIIICATLIIVGIIKNNFNFILNFLARLVSGLAGIFVINWIFTQIGFGLIVGANSYTALTVGVFGIPGFLFVYGVALYYYFT